MINYAMFQRNGRAGYVLKPDALQHPQKELFAKRTSYTLNIKIISAQQLPQPKDASGHEISDKSDLDPFVEVTVFTPDWPVVPESKAKSKNSALDKAAKRKSLKHRSMPEPRSPSPTRHDAGMASTPSPPVTQKTSAVKKNGFNPIWEEDLRLSFDCVADMKDLIFVRFVVRQEEDADEPLGVYCVSLGSLQQGRAFTLDILCQWQLNFCICTGYRHLPLHDSQLSQYLFSTLFVRIHISSR